MAHLDAPVPKVFHMDDKQAQFKRADLTAAIGAGVLGGGIALLLDQALKAYTTPILLLGLLTHSWGMYHKHRLGSGSDLQRIKWAEWLYWGCWAALAVLAISIAARSL